MELTTSTQDRKKVGSSRSRTGCLTCRQRRKKCDEIRPKCQGCTRNFLDCIWPSQRSHPGSANDATTSSGVTDANQRECRHRGEADPADVASKHDSFNSIILRPAGKDWPNGKRQQRPDPKTRISWNPFAASFTGPDRPVSLATNSFLLLQHYVEQTSPVLVAGPAARNPFLNLVLPLAYVDDLLMHAVLALSGTHLQFQNADNIELQLTTSRHYDQLLRHLRSAFADEESHDAQKTLRLLLVLVVVCHFEAMSGQPHGAMFSHLRASRRLISKVLCDHPTGPREIMKKVEGFVIETYLYLVLVNDITPFNGNQTRSIPYDAYFSSFESFEQYETWGTFLGFGKGLFEIIPQVSTLAKVRLAEESSGSDQTSSDQTYEALSTLLTNWQPPAVDAQTTALSHEQRSAGEGYRQALFISLKTAMCGSIVDDPKSIIEIQRHVDTAVPLLMQACASPFVTVMLWPVMIIGSCMIRDDQREILLQGLYQETRINAFQVRQAGQLLERLWADPDKHAYGPFGLGWIMTKHNINFSMA